MPESAGASTPARHKSRALHAAYQIEIDEGGNRRTKRGEDLGSPFGFGEEGGLEGIEEQGYGEECAAETEGGWGAGAAGK